MAKTYDSAQAQRLVPLLEVIGREILERQAQIVRLERRRVPKGTDPIALRAELSGHRRELRNARRELARLGCRVDQSERLTIFIGGHGGAFESGYRWSPGEGTVRTTPLTAERPDGGEG